MAVRSAYALGLHREETMVIFSPEDRAMRRNLWKSLFVMDRFLSCSLGRPTAISEEECSGDTLRPQEPAESDSIRYQSGFAATFSQISNLGLEAAVRSCSVIGSILRRVYQHRQISTKLAQEIADICKVWPKALAPILHWRQAAAASPSQGMAILHVNLFYCHSIVLLTRPFFLFILNDKIQRQLSGDPSAESITIRHARMAKFMEACIIASTHSVKLVQQAFEAEYLPRRDPTVITFLFTAALILLSNEYAMLYSNATDQYIRQAITVMSYCAETDPQASRLLYIMTTFKDVAVQNREQKMRSGNNSSLFPSQNTSQAFPNVSMAPTSMPTTSSAEQFSQMGNMLPTFQFANSQGAPTSYQPTGLSFPESPHQLSATHSVPQHVRSNSASTSPSIANLTTPTPAVATPVAMAQPTSAATSNHDIFSSMLDLTTQDGTMPDEQIDFDALWAWPTPGVGTPRFQQNVMDAANRGTPGGADGQTVPDGVVPLYGVVDN